MLKSIQEKIKTSKIGFSYNTKKWLSLRCYPIEKDLFIVFVHPVIYNSYEDFSIKNIDNLTSLPNRLALEKDIKNISNNSYNISFILLDIKNFHLINQKFGFQIGDFCLLEISSKLKQATHLNDKIYKISSDQFIILSNFDDNILQSIQKLQNIFQEPFLFNNQSFHISVYISYYNQNKNNFFKNPLSCLELALNYAKKNKLPIVEYNSIIHKHRDLFEIEKEIRSAFENEEFEIYLQPQIDNINNKVCGAEALIRWNHPTKGLLSPNDFLHDLEELNYSQQLDSFVFFKVQEYIQKYQIDIPISINLNGKNIENKDFQTMILESNLQHIGFEITESNLLDVHKSTDFFNEIRKLKSFLSIDDFGTGYCSLEYLLHYSVDYLKIEKKFISYIDVNTKNQHIVTNIVKLGHSLNCAIIAEGVERKEELDFLKTHQCDIIQGYYYSKPLPIQEFLNYVSTKGISSFKSYIQ
jgi:diguanylate cyclase (GGDEF)-like protein